MIDINYYIVFLHIRYVKRTASDIIAYRLMSYEL